MCRGIGRLVEEVKADVVKGIAGQVIAGIVLIAGRAAKNRCLVRCLDAQVTAEQTTRRNTGLEERKIAVPTIEWCRLHRQALIGKIAVQYLFDGLRAIRAWQCAVRAVAIIDEANEIRRTEHLEFEVGPNFLDFVNAQAVHVVGGTHQPGFLGPPPGKTHRAARLEPGSRHLQCNFQ